MPMGLSARREVFESEPSLKSIASWQRGWDDTHLHTYTRMPGLSLSPFYQEGDLPSALLPKQKVARVKNLTLDR